VDISRTSVAVALSSSSTSASSSSSSPSLHRVAVRSRPSSIYTCYAALPVGDQRNPDMRVWLSARSVTAIRGDRLHLNAAQHTILVRANSSQGATHYRTVETDRPDRQTTETTGRCRNSTRLMLIWQIECALQTSISWSIFMYSTSRLHNWLIYLLPSTTDDFC